MGHEFVEWPGFIKQAKYCKKCGDWEHEANIWRCSADEPAQARQVGSVSEIASMYEEAQSPGYEHCYGGISQALSKGHVIHDSWTGQLIFSEEDNETILLFDNGHKLTPAQLTDDPAISPDKYVGLMFRFVRIPKGWHKAHGWIADEYIDDVPSTPSAAGGSSTGTRPGNSNAGISNGSQYGFDPSKGLGAVSNSLANRAPKSGLAIQYDLHQRAREAQRRLAEDLFGDNDSEDE